MFGAQNMSTGKDYFDRISTYGSMLLHGQISPLRFANEAVIKPLVYDLARSLGSNEGTIQVADDIFESIYSLATLSPYSSWNNIQKAYEDY